MSECCVLDLTSATWSNEFTLIEISSVQFKILLLELCIHTTLNSTSFQHDLPPPQQHGKDLCVFNMPLISVARVTRLVRDAQAPAILPWVSSISTFQCQFHVFKLGMRQPITVIVVAQETAQCLQLDTLID